ncbi:MAG: Flp pilus assembly protein CpaB [Planctomycetes bacterium]|nr:Flp pilus assembly protein CpaB [Planctomycetota bacterium]
MKIKLAFAVAIALAFAAAIGVKSLIDNRTAQIQDEKNLVTILVAKEKLRAGDVLYATSCDTAQVQGSLANTSFIGAGDLKYFIGQTLLKGVAQGETLLRDNLVEPASQIDFAAQVTKNFRAITIPVDHVTGVAGLIMPKDRVDVLATIVERVNSPTGGTSIMRTITVLENVMVLATDSRTAEHASIPTRYRRAGRGGYASVTLSVTTLEARILTLTQAQSQGMLTLTLRNPIDKQSDIDTITSDDLMPSIIKAANERAKTGKKDTDRTINTTIKAP